MQLCEVGQIDYLTWKAKFQCSKSAIRREELFKHINESCGTMESDLTHWKEIINCKRKECYPLNHLTMKQILSLRKRLAEACTGKIAIDELPLQTFMLLETVNKDVDTILLANVLKDLIPKNAIFMTENGTKDEQINFTDDTDGGSIFEESLGEELYTVLSNTKKQTDSVEIFNKAKDTLEFMGYTDEYAVAALQHCGRHATEDELVAWVLSDECDEENVAELCEGAKANPRLSDLLKDFLEPECEAVSDEEIVFSTTTHQNR